MFVNQAVPVSVPMADAAAGLEAFLCSDSLLQAASFAAFQAGVASALPDGEAKPVIDIVAAQLPALRRGEAVVVAIRWTLANHHGTQTPALDADLLLRPLPSGGCELALCGSYRSPQSAGQPGMDRHTLEAVANTTCLALLNDIATVLTHSVDTRTT